MRAPHAPTLADITLAQLGMRNISAFADALRLGPRVEEIGELFQALLGPGGASQISDGPQWTSDVCDDRTPFEFSLALTQNGGELRALVERLPREASLLSAQRSGVEATEQLTATLGLPDDALERLHRVEPLFHADKPQGVFSRWHAVEFPPLQGPRVKVYLNPLIHGAGASASTLEAALRRLGMAPAWDALTAVRHRGELDELKYFSLDLSPEGRIKVYLRFHRPTRDDLERAFSECRGYAPGRVSEFCRAMCGEVDVLDARPIFTCFGFSGDDPRPVGTVYIPVAGYTNNDEDAHQRVRSYLVDQGIPTDMYDQVMSEFPARPLADGSGLISYVSVKVRDGDPRVTVYLSPEAYEVRPPT
ncbi:MAG: hypothetical protein JKY37_21335 [Nannocystaceae bacterium]|nr:hypothetical protein [Nannocystaceae bacterium]